MLTPQQLEIISDEYYLKGFLHGSNRGRWSKNKRCERAKRNMRAHPGEVRVVELASLRSAPSRAVRLVGLAGELRIKVALFLSRLALLRGRIFKRRSRCSLFVGPVHGVSC
jgi:hypothetical protein